MPVHFGSVPLQRYKSPLSFGASQMRRKDSLLHRLATAERRLGDLCNPHGNMSVAELLNQHVKHSIA